MTPRIPQHKAEQLSAEMLKGETPMRQIALREGLPYQLLKDVKGERSYYSDKKKVYKIHKQ